MKHVFLINPVAGKGKATTELLPSIIKTLSNNDVDYIVHRTINVGDAFKYVRALCEKNPDDEMRFYSCGGDGTMNEVLNGIIGYKNVQLAVIPAGTGNDFVRNFGDIKKFKDIESQINGIASPIDIIKYQLLEPTGEENIPTTGYALNMFNTGFDAEVVKKTAEIKGPVIKGTLAYIAGVGIVLKRLKKVDMAVEIDGEEVYSGEFLLAGIANGRFSGGGFDGMPLAVLDDGKMDAFLVKSITRRAFISLVKKYHDGTHLDEPKLKDIFFHYPCEEAIFRPKENITLAVDGETTEVGAIKFSLVPNAILFSAPKEIVDKNSKDNNAENISKREIEIE